MSTKMHTYTQYMKRYNTSGAVITNKKTQEHQCDFNHFGFSFFFAVVIIFPETRYREQIFCFSILFI